MASSPPIWDPSLTDEENDKAITDALAAGGQKMIDDNYQDRVEEAMQSAWAEYGVCWSYCFRFWGPALAGLLGFRTYGELHAKFLELPANKAALHILRQTRERVKFTNEDVTLVVNRREYTTMSRLCHYLYECPGVYLTEQRQQLLDTHPDAGHFFQPKVLGQKTAKHYRQAILLKAMNEWIATARELIKLNPGVFVGGGMVDEVFGIASEDLLKVHFLWTTHYPGLWDYLGGKSKIKWAEKPVYVQPAKLADDSTAQHDQQVMKDTAKELADFSQESKAQAQRLQDLQIRIEQLQKGSEDARPRKRSRK